MGLGQERFVALAAEFQGSLQRRNAILFLGRGVDDETAKQIVSSYEWRMLVTSRETVPMEEKPNLHTMRYKTKAEITAANLWKKDEFPIISLWETHTPLGEDALQQLECTGQSAEEYRRKTASDILEQLCRLLDGQHVLVVAGYQPTAGDDMPYTAFASVIYERDIPAGSLQFWNEPETETPLKKLAEAKNAAYHTEDLAQVLAALNSLDDTEDQTAGSEEELLQIFYKNGKSCSVPSRELLPYRKIAALLTEQMVFSIQPFGKVVQAKWFYNFLIKSPSDGPQWYGYLKRSNYHLNREFEAALYYAIKRELDGESIVGSQKDMPVILSGAPGSSKSVALAALAFRIYNEHQNPVIFIDNDTLLFSDQSAERTALLELMEQVDACKGDARILLIWDCSSYQNVTSKAQQLSRMLTNRGRRFVLVCSAYEMSADGTEKRRGYAFVPGEKAHFALCGEGTPQMFVENGCCYITTTREMNEKEKVGFWHIIHDFSGIDREQLNSAKAELKDQPDIFQCFYQMVGLMRPKLENALGREEMIVSEYVRKQLEEVFQEKVTLGPIAQALLDAGLSREEVEQVRQQMELGVKETAKEYDLEKFNTCIALFGRFKLSVPYPVALWMLRRDYDYTEKPIDPELYNVLTSQIPWLHYGEMDNSPNYAFRFRNALEAEIFLERNGVSADRQVGVLCEIMELYQERWEEVDSSFARELQQFIRLIGPNSRYTAFRENGEKKYEHDAILRQSETIIQALKKLCGAFPDQDAGFATLLVTFTREYYGRKWDDLYREDLDAHSEECYQKRIKKLFDTIAYASNRSEKLERLIEETSGGEKKYLSDQKNGLIVETTRCNIWLCKNEREYFERFGGEGKKRSRLNYEDVYQKLYKAILASPENGHIYNALFDAFEEVYQYGELSSRQKLEYLSKTKMISDDCFSQDIQNRDADDHDELREHILRIQQFAADYKVTIEDVQQDRMNPEFAKLYHDMIEANQPMAVTFVCQQELDRAGITGAYSSKGDMELDAKQRAVCRRVADFMMEGVNRACIQGNYFAMSLLLRVVWMSSTGRRLTGTEGQRIQLNAEQWEELRRISQQCCTTAQNGTVGNGANPLFTLVYALAELQCTGNFKKCSDIIQSIGTERFITSFRMRVPFIYCDQKGPFHYKGTIEKMEGRTFWLRLEDCDAYLSNRVRYRAAAYDRPRENEYLQRLILGIGYNGFSAYKDNGPERR